MSELTQEEIKRLPDLLHEMTAHLHFGGDPEDTRSATEVWSELWFCDADYLAVFKAARLALDEPSRLAPLLDAEVRSILIEAGRLLTSTPSEELAAVDAVVDRMAVLLNSEPNTYKN